MNTAKVFTTGRSQAVRLPKEYRFLTESVFVKKIDDMVILIPIEKVWDNFSKSLEKFPDNFMSDRIQPDIESRENIKCSTFWIQIYVFILSIKDPFQF